MAGIDVQMCSVESSNETATVCFPDGTRSLVPLHVVHRSPILYDSLTATSEEDDAVIYAPLRLFHNWLECAALLANRQSISLHDAEPELLVTYLMAADYFADEDAVHTICGVLGRRLFNNDSSQQLGKQHSLDTTIAGLWQEGGCWTNRVQQVLNQLPDNLAISVLRASATSLDSHISLLKAPSHLLAVHAAFPSLLPDGTLHVDCSLLTTSTATATLLAAAPLDTSVYQGSTTMHEVQHSPLISQLHVSSVALRSIDNVASAKFTSALCCAVCSAPQHVSITSADISNHHFQRILAAMARNSRLETLEIALFDSLRAREPPLAAVIAHGLAQLTGLRNLILRNMPERADFLLPRTLQPLTLQTTLQCLTLLTQLQLDSSIQCAEGISSFVSKLVHLHTLELCVYVYKECHVDDLSLSLTHLTALRNLTCAGEGYAVLPALASPPLASLEKLDVDLSSGSSSDVDLQKLVEAVRNMHELHALALRVPGVGTGEASVALLDTLRHCTGFSNLMLRGVHVVSPTAGLMLCQRIAALSTLRHLHLHTCAVFVPLHPSRTHAILAEESLATPHPRIEVSRSTPVATSLHPHSPDTQTQAYTGDESYTNFVHIHEPIAGSSHHEVAVGDIDVDVSSTSANVIPSAPVTEGTRPSSSTTTASTRRIVVNGRVLHKGPLVCLTQLTHLTLRESSDWGRLESTLRDYTMPLQPLTSFLLSGLSSLRGLRYLEVDDDLQDGSPQQLAKSLAAGFTHMPCLESLRLLSCNMSARGARDIATSLEGCEGITKLDLNRAFWDQQGIREIAPVFRKLVHLRHLTVVGDAYLQLSSECAGVIASSLQGLSKVEHFILTCCRFEAGALEALTPGIQHLTALQHLDLSFNGIIDSTIPHLACTLQHLPSLQCLCLSENELTAHGTETLVSAALTLNKLQALDLTYNPIGDEGAVALARLLAVKTSLRTVDVSCAQIGDAGERAVLEVMSEDDPMRCRHMLDMRWPVGRLG